VRELRDARGWSQAKLAEVAGVRPATISEIESGASTAVHFATLERVADALGVDAAVLIDHQHAHAITRKWRKKP
jgi:transcriptional regulator with XRE-family HTH domain